MRKQSEQEFLKNYDPRLFDRPSATVDTVIFTVLDEGLHVLTVKRDEHPYKGRWSLVGGFIDIDKDRDLEETARRKLAEKTGVRTPYLEQFGTIGNKKRDPRGWSITTVYFALIPGRDIELRPGEGARDIKWSKIVDGQVKDRLAFDHQEILSLCLKRLRSKVLYTSLPVYLMPPEFSLGELQKVYELILEARLDHKSFRRRITSADILEETGRFSYEAKRPAQLYRFKGDLTAHFFTRNIEGVG